LLIHPVKSVSSILDGRNNFAVFIRFKGEAGTIRKINEIHWSGRVQWIFLHSVIFINNGDFTVLYGYTYLVILGPKDEGSIAMEFPFVHTAVSVDGYGDFPFAISGKGLLY
jgi:hypothetical protein